MHNPLTFELPRLGLGTSTFGREIDEETSRHLLDYATDRGLRLIDTAEGYGGGNAQAYRRQTLGVDDQREVSVEMHSSEKIIGRWLRDRDCRNDVILLTKASSGGSPENIHRSVKASLERLQTDVIDIYMLHSPDPSVPLAETWDALTREVEAGNIRFLGCSNFSLELMEEAMEFHPDLNGARLCVVELPLNLAVPPEGMRQLEFCKRRGLPTLTYSPLAAGFLTGKYGSGKAIPPRSRFDIIPGHQDLYFNERSFRILFHLEKMADRCGSDMASLAMAWATGHPSADTVLVGARETRHLDQALQSLREPLPEDWREEMNRWTTELGIP